MSTNTSSMRIPTLSFAMLIVCSAFGQSNLGAERTPAAIPQSQEYIAYLQAIGQLGKLGTQNLQNPLMGLPTGDYVAAEDMVAGGTLGASLLFIDATGGTIDVTKVTQAAIVDLEAVYSALPKNRYGLEAIRFCYRTAVADQPFAYDPHRERLWRSDFGDASSFDFSQWTTYMEDFSKDSRQLDPAAIHIVIVEGEGDLLGFTGGLWGVEGPLNPIVVDAKLLAGEVEGKARAKVLAHLLACHLGLRPLWYPGEQGGDLVEDTPQHNRPNAGSYDGSIHLSLIEGMPRELVDNVMDNADSGAEATWTPGQIELLRRCLAREALPFMVSTGKDCPEGYHHADQRPINDVVQLHLSPPSDSQLKMTIFPNPAKDILQINLLMEYPHNLLPESNTVRQNLQLQFMDGSGRVAQSALIEFSSTTEVSLEQDISKLTSGLYQLVLREPTKQNVLVTKSFVKQ